MSLVVTDNVGNVSAASAVATTTPGAEILVETAEGTSLGWSGDAPWAISSERVASPIHSWTDSPGVPYATSVDRSLRSPSFSLETATQPQLSFWHLFNIEQGFDFGTVLISTDGGTGWTEIARYTGGRDLSAVVLDLSPYAGSPDVRLRFRLQSDSVISFDGWYIDDIIVTARDTAAPRAPENLTASVGDGAVTLDWADNSEPDLAGYLVYRTTDPPDASPRAWTSIGTPTLSDFIDDGVATGVPYFYRVSAVDTSGNESPPSGEIQAEVADTTPPGPPGGLMATAGNLVVTLDWADNTESDVAGYIVYRSADPPEISSRTWTSVAAPTSSAHADSTVVNGTTYFYRVTALDASGNESSPSGEVAATPTPPIGSFAPDAVTISKGSTLGDPLASLAAADDAYFRVASTRSGTNHFVDWFASSRITAGAVTRLMVTYEGSWSSPTAQSLSIRDFSNGRWETISSATVATADVSVSWSTGTASPYISAQGEVRLRVVTKSRTSVTCRADLIRVTVQY
jgi:hypothetical protein